MQDTSTTKKKPLSSGFFIAISAFFYYNWYNLNNRVKKMNENKKITENTDTHLSKMLKYLTITYLSATGALLFLYVSLVQDFLFHSLLSIFSILLIFLFKFSVHLNNSFSKETPTFFSKSGYHKFFFHQCTMIIVFTGAFFFVQSFCFIFIKIFLEHAVSDQVIRATLSLLYFYICTVVLLSILKNLTKTTSESCKDFISSFIEETKKKTNQLTKEC